MSLLERLRRRWAGVREMERLMRGLRGRVHRVNVLTSGEKSVVLRFGIEEADRVKFRPGNVLEVSMVERPPPPAPAERAPEQGPEQLPAELTEGAPPPIETWPVTPGGTMGYPCNCGASEGKPHEVDCIWWDGTIARQLRYDALMAQEYGKPISELTPDERTSPALFEVHERVVALMAIEDRQRKGRR